MRPLPPRRLAPVLAALALLAAAAAPAAQTDLDQFMSRVLERRDENWKKMQQYTLEEREVLQLTGPADVPIYGFVRDYTWYLRDGIFVRSPLRANGAEVAEDERRRYEDDWIRRERRRRRDEPRFVSAAYFLRFRFDPGQYALVGRETLAGREVLRIEYYPTKLFTEGRARPSRRVRERDDEVEEKMNKASLVTLWIDPAIHQILKYDFDNLDMDFLPGRALVRMGEIDAVMEMGQPFPGVWLPASIRIRVGMLSAAGAAAGRYDITYHDYRLADVKSRIRVP
ncbi:MAG: hypothetical protein AB1635_21150 [Acidobacteriota bacterium]